MAAADEARMAGQPERAAQLLTELLAEHEADPAMAVAAFTLGRVLLLELGRYPEAAAAFAQARGLAPEGAFAEDALAREVESWAKAGQTARARDKAQTYLRLYPRGRRTDEVKAQGGLE